MKKVNIILTICFICVYNIYGQYDWTNLGSNLDGAKKNIVSAGDKWSAGDSKYINESNNLIEGNPHDEVSYLISVKNMFLDFLYISYNDEKIITVASNKDYFDAVLIHNKYALNNLLKEKKMNINEFLSNPDDIYIDSWGRAIYKVEKISLVSHREVESSIFKSKTNTGNYLEIIIRSSIDGILFLPKGILLITKPTDFFENSINYENRKKRFLALGGGTIHELESNGFWNDYNGNFSRHILIKNLFKYSFASLSIIYFTRLIKKILYSIFYLFLRIKNK